MVIAAVWTLIGVVIAGGIASFSLLRNEIASLGARIDAQGQEIHQLAETQAEMNGKLDVVVRQAHTHTAA